MAKVKIAGKDVDFVLNNYTLFHYGRAVGAKQPLEAIQKMSSLKDGYTFDGQEALALFIHHCTKKEITLEQAFDEVMNVELLEKTVIPAINDYVAPFVNVAETEKKKKATVAT